MRSFSEIVNSKIFFNINEANIVDWFSSFINKTSDFINIWQKKGGHKYKIDTNKGTIQSNKQEIKINFNGLKSVLSKSKIYKKCYPNTINYINHEEQTLRPEIIDKNEWDNVIVKMYVYTPEVNYNGENYPCAIGIYPQKKIELLENYFHIQSFETSSLIANKDITNQIFETFIDDIRKSKGTSFVGITLIAKNPSKYSKYLYKGKRFEETEIKDSSNEQDKEKDDKIVDNNDTTITILKLDF